MLFGMNDKNLVWIYYELRKIGPRKTFNDFVTKHRKIQNIYQHFTVEFEN